MDVVPMLILAPVLVAVAYFDLRFMRIPNALSLMVLAVFAVVMVFLPPADLFARLAIAGSVFMIGFIGFSLSLIGGGDVKILSALMLVVPTGGIAVFANVFSISMLVGILLVLAIRRFPQVSSMGWKSFGGSHKFPMGLSIALTGLAFPVVSLVMQGS
jgi:prepilin peptidase CpaA